MYKAEPKLLFVILLISHSSDGLDFRNNSCLSVHRQTVSLTAAIKEVFDSNLENAVSKSIENHFCYLCNLFTTIKSRYSNN